MGFLGLRKPAAASELTWRVIAIYMFVSVSPLPVSIGGSCT